MKKYLCITFQKNVANRKPKKTHRAGFFQPCFKMRFKMMSDKFFKPAKRGEKNRIINKIKK